MKVLRTILCLFVCAAIISGLKAETAPSEAHQDWTSVTNLRPGRRLTVRLKKGLGKKARGVFVSGDSGAMTMLDRQGAERTVPRDHIRSVRAGRERRYGKWVGMAVGAAVIGLTVNRAFAGSDDDLSAGGHLAVLGFGAGIGALVGMLVDRTDVLIYKTAKRGGPASEKSARRPSLDVRGATPILDPPERRRAASALSDQEID